MTAPTPDRSKYWELIEKIEAGDITLSFSAFKEFAESPQHFIRYKLREKKQTDAMIFGSMFHCLVLEPEEFDSRFAVAPKVDRRTKAGKLEWEIFCEANAGKDIVKAVDFELAQRMQEKVMQNEASRFLVTRFDKKEEGVQWEFGGFKWRGYIDGEGESIIGDLKVMADAKPRKVGYTIRDMRYHWQPVFYRMAPGRSHKIPFILAVDRNCNVTCVEFSDADIRVAQDQIEWYLTKFHQCIAMGDWHKSYDFYAGRDGFYKASRL